MNIKLQRKGAIKSFRNNYLALALILLSFLAYFDASAQWTKPNNSYGTIQNRINIPVAFLFPVGCGAPSLSTPDANQKGSALYFDSCDHVFYVYDPSIPSWSAVGSGGSGTGRDTIKLGYGLRAYWDSTNHQVVYAIHADGLISGGLVTGAGGFNLDVTSALYILKQGTQYVSPSIRLTVPAADPSLARKDIVVVDTNGVASIIPGTPASLPQLPQANPASQIVLTSYDVPAGATSLLITTKYIYREGTEWDTAHSGTMNIAFRNTDRPYNGTHDIFVKTYTDGSQIILTDSGPDTVVTGMVWKGFLYLNTSLGGNSFQMQFFNGSTAVSNLISINPYIGVLDTLQYQNVTVPLFAFVLPVGTVFTRIVITMRGNDLSGAAGFYLDDIQLQSGINNFTSGHGVFNFVINATSDTAILTRDDGIIFKVKMGNGSGGGTVSNLHDSTTNGVAITWLNRTTTPSPVVALGNITPTTVTTNSINLLRQFSATSPPAHGNTLFDSSGLGIRDSTGRTVFLTKGLVTAGTTIIDSFQNKSGRIALLSDITGGSQTLPQVLSTGRTLNGNDSIIVPSGKYFYTKGGISKADSVNVTSNVSVLGGVKVDTLTVFPSKKIYTFGTSVTFGTAATLLQYNYPNLIAKRLNATLVNDGVSSSLISDFLSTQIALLPNNSDSVLFVTLEYAINESGVESTYWTQLATAIDTLTTTGHWHYPLSKIVIFSGTPTGALTRSQTILKRLSDSTVAICNRKGVQVINSFDYLNLIGVPVVISSDSVHPNNAGHNAIADAFSKQINYGISTSTLTAGSITAKGFGSIDSVIHTASKGDSVTNVDGVLVFDGYNITRRRITFFNGGSPSLFSGIAYNTVSGGISFTGLSGKPIMFYNGTNYPENVTTSNANFVINGSGNANFSGNVGIGIGATDPTSLLQLNKTGSAIITLNSTTSGDAAFVMDIDGVAKGDIQVARSAGDIVGGTAAGAMVVKADGPEIDFASTPLGGVILWKMNSSGHLVTPTDNTYDIGASGTTRPRTGYFGTSVIAPAFAGNLTGNITGNITGAVTATRAASNTVLQTDTIPLFVFGGGGANVGDTTSFTTSTIYGSFFNSGTDTLVITRMQIGLQGVSASITLTVYYNDSLNVTAGATKLVNAGNAATDTNTGTSVTSFDNAKIPPGVWVWAKTTTVTTKPTYLTASLIGTKIRAQ